MTEETKDKTYTILKVIVGSQAHGLAGPDSDTDYRSVYVLPTEKILSLGYKYKGSQWLEGETEDNTAWELGHFLSLAKQCNPTILEVFLAPHVPTPENPITGMSYHANELKGLFPYLWTPEQAFNAFTGYGKNQQKKFLDKKDHRPNKYASAHIRTLVNLIELLEKGTFTIRVADLPLVGTTLRRIRQGDYTPGEVIDITENLTRQAEMALENCSKVFPNNYTEDERYEKVNNFLLDVRAKYWYHAYHV